MLGEAVPEGGGRCAGAWVVVRVTGNTGVSGAVGSRTDAGTEVSVWASGRVVGSVGRGSRSWTCSLKCVQRVVTPVVAQVLIWRRVRCPSLSVQSRRCGLRRVRRDQPKYPGPYRSGHTGMASAGVTLTTTQAPAHRPPPSGTASPNTAAALSRPCHQEHHGRQ